MGAQWKLLRLMLTLLLPPLPPLRVLVVVVVLVLLLQTLRNAGPGFMSIWWRARRWDPCQAGGTSLEAVGGCIRTNDDEALPLRLAKPRKKLSAMLERLRVAVCGCTYVPRGPGRQKWSRTAGQSNRREAVVGGSRAGYGTQTWSYQR